MAALENGAVLAERDANWSPYIHTSLPLEAALRASIASAVIGEGPCPRHLIEPLAVAMGARMCLEVEVIVLGMSARAGEQVLLESPLPGHLESEHLGLRALHDGSSGGASMTPMPVATAKTSSSSGGSPSSKSA